MSSETAEIVSQSDYVDVVDDFAGSKRETVEYLGLDTPDSGSITLPRPLTCDSTLLNILNNEKIDSENASKNDLQTNDLRLTESSSPTLVSLETTTNIRDITVNKHDTEDGVEEKALKEVSSINFEAESVPSIAPSNREVISVIPKKSPREHRNPEIDLNLELNGIDFKYSSQNLMTSTVSLNEEVNCNYIQNKNITLSKSMHSKSAENISVTGTTSNLDVSSRNSSSKDLDSEQILTEFKNQKMKVQATQKIVPENPQTNLDVRYPRIPKELLNQDLGSIVKNVHGIFSSVSGSLKHAYNISHNRATAPKPVPKVLPSRPVPHSHIMNEIFEEEPVSVEKEEVSETQSMVSLPEQELADCDSDTKKDIMHLQVESLERLLVEQRKEIAVLRERVRQQTDELQEKDLTFKDLEGKMDLMRKLVSEAEREKDLAVMRYASSECALIEARRTARDAGGKERAACAELDLVLGKLKSAQAERQRICQMYDDKCHELAGSERELAKVRDDVKELEGRLKWTQSKLRLEMDAYKESAERVEKLEQQVSALESARETGVTLRATQLESEVKESRAALILCRHESDELERRVTSLGQQLDAAVRERDDASGALARATLEVASLRESNLRLEEEAAALAALRARAALADTLSAQLQRECERATHAEEALSKERARAETCARREAAALEHAATLTAQHVAERASCSDGEAKAQALSADNASLRARTAQLEETLAALRGELGAETERRRRDNAALARKVAELSSELSSCRDQTEWQRGENAVLKKKHAAALRELNRELRSALKRCSLLEAKIPAPDTDPAHRTLAAGSVSSLSSGEGAALDDKLHNGHSSDAVPDIQTRSPDAQALIERIVSLQRAAARRAERCDFLEEHARQLTEELRNKSRVLRQLLCAAPAGALADTTSDRHKKEIARLGGGAMAAVWGGDPAGMTLELSLEMNKRLQAVLEDTLLKNITLKENMDTLGEEIAKLKGTKQPPDSK